MATPVSQEIKREPELVEVGTVDVGDLTPCYACMFFITSCFFVTPDCYGLFGNVTFLCVESEYKCCKAAKKEGDLCLCIDLSMTCIQPTTCIKGIMQCFCLDTRVALPPDDDVPCMCTFLFVSCCYKYKPNCQFGQQVKFFDPELDKAGK